MIETARSNPSIWCRIMHFLGLVFMSIWPMIFGRKLCNDEAFLGAITVFILSITVEYGIWLRAVDRKWLYNLSIVLVVLSFAVPIIPIIIGLVSVSVVEAVTGLKIIGSEQYAITNPWHGISISILYAVINGLYLSLIYGICIMIDIHTNKLYGNIKTVQQVDSAEASTIAVPPSSPSGSPR